MDQTSINVNENGGGACCLMNSLDGKLMSRGPATRKRLDLMEDAWILTLNTLMWLQEGLM